MSKTSPLRRYAHHLAGLLTALAPSWWLGLLAFLTFASYETAEYVKKRDTLYLEFHEYSVGFYLGLLLRIILSSLGIHVYG